MKEHPILFSGEMVRAILAGRKTVTRRVIKPQPDIDTDTRWRYDGIDAEDGGHWIELLSSDGMPTEKYKCVADKCPYGEVGDRLWVREKFRLVDFEYVDDWNASVQCGADMELGPRLHDLDDDSGIKTGWRPSIHMPRAASRITLEITDVRVERLQDITEDDAISEGMLLYHEWETAEYKKVVNEAHENGTKPPLGFSPRQRFIHLWDALYAKRGYGWNTNPYVWVISFMVIKESTERELAKRNARDARHLKGVPREEAEETRCQ
jgi:hypothetical protein